MQGSQMLIRKTRLTLLALLLGVVLAVAPLPGIEQAGPGMANATIEAPPKPHRPNNPATIRSTFLPRREPSRIPPCPLLSSRRFFS